LAQQKNQKAGMTWGSASLGEGRQRIGTLPFRTKAKMTNTKTNFLIAGEATFCKKGVPYLQPKPEESDVVI